MINADFFGYTATIINMVMLLPQVIQTWKTKETKDLSLATLTLFFLASLLWLTYGVIKMADPIIVANITLGLMNLILILFKFKYKNKISKKR
jgi:MtN3 and saliva related transmembrane protein